MLPLALGPTSSKNNNKKTTDGAAKTRSDQLATFSAGSNEGLVQLLKLGYFSLSEERRECGGHKRGGEEGVT